MNKKILIVNDQADCGVHYDELFKELGYDIIKTYTGQVNVEYLLAKCHAVCFTGGSDVNPNLYNELATAECGYIDHQRDQFESDIFHMAYEHGVDILGICRGLQFINVMLEGTLYQHINEHGSGFHPVKYDNQTYLVNSFHHQAIKSVGADTWVVDMLRAKDGSIEAVCWGDSIMGVQWHPEIGGDGKALFKKLYKDYIW